MKPVVSSLVALAIAIAAPVAMASPEKPTPAKHAVHKVAKKDKDKKEKAEKASLIVHVKHTIRGARSPRPSGEHVDGHKGEPKVDPGVMVVPASLTSKPKLTPAKLPAPSASNAKAAPAPAPAKMKGAHEKGVRKPMKKSADDAANDGQPERDEEFAELVARIRGKSGKRAACAKEPVELARGSEVETFQLVTCDGAPAPLAVEKLSVLVRPGSAVRPIASFEELAKKKGAEIAKGIRRVDPRLVERLEAIAEHFGKSGPIKFEIVSGYRPTSPGSMHAIGKAIDFRIDGAKNEDVVAFCKTLNDTGCGFYPNSSFVHVDVRDVGAGHVSWIDASGPGEQPRYVTQWPEPIASAAQPKAPDACPTPSPSPIEKASAKHEEPAPPSDPATTLEPLP